jgi:hypothetical protein
MDRTQIRRSTSGLLAALCVSLGAAAPTAFAQVSVGVSIGFNVPAYPRLAVVPGYPVYYAPGLNVNYFFYDGLYWVFVGDNWYHSFWYDGPWTVVQPAFVPVYILRVPVRYYRVPPPYFHAWAAEAPPRWGERWGPAWEQKHRGWDRWNRASAPPPAPLPTYQKQYAGERYPRSAPQQQALQGQHYRYQPKDAVVRQRYEQSTHEAAAPQRSEPSRHEPRPQRAQPMQVHPEQRGAAPTMHRPPRGEEAIPQPEQRPPEAQGAPHEPRPGQRQGEEKRKGKGKDKDKREEREQ